MLSDLDTPRTAYGDSKGKKETYLCLIMKSISAEFAKGLRGSDPILYDGTPQIAFIGRSNVGKSSVINALVGRKNLVKTSAKPGKTTEINVFTTNAGVHLIDLPGYGYARVSPDEKDRIRKMILWYLTEAKIENLTVVLILDVKAGFTEFDADTLKVLREQKHSYIIVANKIDKLNQKELVAQLRQIRADSHDDEIVECSTVVKDGVKQLFNALFV